MLKPSYILSNQCSICTLPTVTHYLMSNQNLKDTRTRVSGWAGFSLVIINLWRGSAEWPSQSPSRQAVTVCPSADLSPQWPWGFPGVSRVWEPASWAAEPSAARGGALRGMAALGSMPFATSFMHKSQLVPCRSQACLEDTNFTANFQDSSMLLAVLVWLRLACESFRWAQMACILHSKPRLRKLNALV